MPINSNEIQFICGNSAQLGKMPELKRLSPFSDIVCDFLAELSALLMKHPRAKAFPDVITFGFFCRHGNISRLKSQYSGICENRLGRGVTFHIAPSNVPINFAYSLVAALLAGNSCIVRASSKQFEQGIKCACGGRDDLLKIYVVSADNDMLAKAVNFISTKLELNRSAFKAVSIDEIPRNESGKVLYSKLEELYD